MHFGAKGRLERPLSNPKLIEALRAHEGEYVLFVGCAWRIDDQDALVAGCWDDDSDGGSMLAGSRRLIEQSVRTTAVRAPSRM